MNRNSLLALAILAILQAPAFAAEETGDQSWANDPIFVTGKRISFAEPNAATATRTPTPIEEIPQSIQTLTRTLIEEQDLQTLSDALVNISGVVPTRTMETVLQPALIRGFPVSYYYDGLPTYGLPAGTSDPATLVNVERVEVAKGPTSTLYGGGTGAPLSGLINIVSRNPEPEFGGSVAVRAGSFNTFGGELDLNLPLGEAVAFRINGMVETADSHIRVVDSDRYAFFPTLSWQVSEDTRLTLRGQFNRLEQREYSGLPAELTIAPALIIKRDAFAGAEDAPRTVVENSLYTATLDHRFSDTLEGSIAVRRYDGKFDEYATFPFGQIAGTLYNFGSGIVPSDVDKTFVTASLLKRLATGRVQHQILVGADHDKTDYFGAMGLNLFEYALIDYADPSTNAPFSAIPEISDRQNDEMRSNAIFAQDQIAIGERLDLTVGLRWTRLEVQSRYTSFGFPFVDTDETYNRFTPRIGATYKVLEGLSLFAGYAEGFQGVVAAFGVTKPDPETSQSYEAGIKFAAPIDGLTGTVSLYQITRQNVVTADPGNPGFSIQSGEQRARGFEADLVYEPSPAWSILFNYAYTDAEVTKDNALPVGDRLRRVPQNSGRLATRYRFQGATLRGLEIGGGVTAVSDRELTLPNTVAVDGLALVDAQASYDIGAFTVGLSIVNLTGEDGFEPYQYFNGAYVIPTQSRSAYVTLRARF